MRITSRLVKEFLEAEEKGIQMQESKDLEIEVKNLKDLMFEIHKNQMELGSVLLKKGIYSPSIIKLTNPSMLEEETKAVRRMSQMQIKSSTEALQVKIKCKMPIERTIEI